MTLDDDLRSYFVRKIVTSMMEHGVDVVSDPNEDEVVRAAIAQISSTPEDLHP
jgi:hypothetical protein